MSADNEGAARLKAVIRGLIQLPILQQLGLLIGLLASIALGAYIVLWSLTPASGNEVLNDQLQYRHALEQHLAAKIESILLPITGANRVRAQAVVELEFAQATAPLSGLDPGRRAPHSLPGSIEHFQGNGLQNGSSIVPAIRRISIVVLVDNKQTRNASGEVVAQAYSEHELAQLAALAGNAVGLNAQRGDTLDLTNTEFQSLPEPDLLEQPRVRNFAKQVLGILFAMLVLFGVIRPVMRNLSGISGHEREAVGDEDILPDAQPGMRGERDTRQLPRNAYEAELAKVRAMAAQEPKRVAQLVRLWVHEG